MKKIFAIALAVVMVLSIASVASAFEWGPSAATTNDNFGAKITVEKYALQTGVYGWSYQPANDITAANGADVYYVIKIQFTKDIAPEDGYTATIDYTGIEGTDWSGNVWGDKGTIEYYNGTNWVGADVDTDIDDIVIRARCFDTSEAEITAEVVSERELTNKFEIGDYEAKLANDGSSFAFWKDGNLVANFALNADRLVTGVTTGVNNNGITADDVMDLYAWLNNGSATEFQNAVNSRQVYMTNANLYAAFGFSYKSADSVSWTATNYPIIVDTNVGIPKTGDNASVIGFAMIMVAVVAAAVAVRKVNA